MIIGLGTWVIHRLLHVTVISWLLLIYGISLSSFHKWITAVLAVAYWLGFYSIGAILFNTQKCYDIGCVYLFLSICTIPFSIMTLQRKYMRIWAPITTLIFSLFVIIYNSVYVLGIIPYILFWILIIDLCDNLLRNGLTERSFNLISEISIVVCICIGALGSYLKSRSDWSLDTQLNHNEFIWAYVTAVILTIIRICV